MKIHSRPTAFIGGVRCLISVGLSLALMVHGCGMAWAGASMVMAPLSSAFTSYQKDLQTKRSSVKAATGPAPSHGTGYVPPPYDTSHMTGKVPSQMKASIKASGTPTSFDLRNSGNDPPVQDQGLCGDCWAFATMTSLESNMLASSAGSYNFSENNLNVQSGFDVGACNGGNTSMSTAYLARWGNQQGYAAGPVFESDDPYTSTTATSVSGLSPRFHDQQVLFLPDRAGSVSNSTWKEALILYGAFTVNFWIDSGADTGTTSSYWNQDTASYYDYDHYKGQVNHQVTIVGWDDNYPASNFSTKPGGNGAFLAQNQWGTFWGDNGYFWISYYDVSISGATVFRTPDSTSNYAYQYMYDPLGHTSDAGDGSTTAWAANVFTSPTDQSLAAVGFYTNDVDTQYAVTIYTNLSSGTEPTSGYKSSTVLTGTMPFAGYHTVQLSSPVQLTAGQPFSVVVKYDDSSYGYPIPVESPILGYSSGATASAGQSFVSPDGVNWNDLSTLLANTNATIHAYTDASSTVDGACGSANGRILTSPPTSSAMCAVGTTSGYTIAGTTYNWTCNGNGGGSDSACSATMGYTVTGQAGVGGSISPSQQAVASGNTATLSASADSGYSLASVTGCGGNWSGGGTYTTGPVLANCTVTASFDVIPQPQTITFGAAPIVAVGSTGTLSATGGGSGNPVVFSSLTPSVCTVSGSVVTGVTAGTCTVAANQDGGKAYLVAQQATQSFDVAKGSQAIAFGASPDIAVGGSGTITATGGPSGNPVVFSSLTPSICSVSGNTVTSLTGGICYVAANQAGNADYDPAPQLTLRIYIGAAQNNSAIVTTVAGNGTVGYGGDNGLATGAQLNDPTGIAVDANGNFYIADYSNSRIRRVDGQAGIITTVAGDGTAGYGGANGPATDARLNYPTGVALDAEGNLYIADSRNNRIREVDAVSGIISVVAGSGTAGYAGDNGPATGAHLNHPTGIALDAQGNLYIADADNNRVREVAAGSGIITTVAGDGVAGYGGDGGPATGARLDSPTGVALDAQGNLYIADAGNNRVREVAAGSGIITTVAGDGTAGYGGDGGPATGAQLDAPTGVAVDVGGNLFISDAKYDIVRMVAADSGIISTVAGNGTFGYSGDGGPATGAQLNYPWGLALDPNGNLLLADSYNNRIREVLFNGITPRNGLWIINSENNGQNGRGLQVETHGGTLVLTYYGYLAGGQDHWYLATGPLSDGVFTGTLEQYRGGTALGGTYTPATADGSAGTVSLTFDSATAGTVTLPGESPTVISKFAIGSGPSPGIMPQNGLWIIDAENNGQDGRGFQIEQSGGTVVFTYYGYDSSGQEVWYLAAGTMNGNSFTGNLIEYSGGTALGGPYTPAQTSGIPGQVTITFTSPTTGTIRLPRESVKAMSKLSW